MSVKNKLIAAGVGISMFVPILAFAQTTTVSSSIQTLLDQIKTLQAQIVALQQQQITIRQQQQTALSSLVSTLRQGSTGDQVTTLQTLLALDPSMYPEGKITGFFGKLTALAVKRFQKKHGFEQVGDVGPKTLQKLNELFGHMGSSTKTNENEQGDNNQGDNEHGNGGGVGKVTLCHKPGHESGETISVGSPAVAAHLAHGDTIGACSGGTVTITPPVADTAAPIISGIGATPVSGGATIMWTTNEAATSKVYYATASPLDLMSALNVSNATLVTSHGLSISGLATSTTYYYVLESKDAANNTATTSVSSLVTL